MGAEDLAGEAVLAEESALFEFLVLGSSHRIGFTGDEYHPACCAARLTAAPMTNVDAHVLDSVDQSLVCAPFSRFACNCQSGYTLVLLCAVSV